MIEGQLVKLATRLIVEEALEGEASATVGRDYTSMEHRLAGATTTATAPVA